MQKHNIELVISIILLFLLGIDGILITLVGFLRNYPIMRLTGYIYMIGSIIGFIFLCTYFQFS